MKLSAPKNITWWVAIALGVLGFLGNFTDLGGLGATSFWLLFLGFALLAVATMVDGL